jgi:molybdate transport system substrate-binding protein
MLETGGLPAACGRMAMKTCALAAASLASLLSLGGAVDAAEITVISSVGVKPALEVLAPQFERASEHKVKLVFGTAAPLKRQVDAGESFDVVILTPAMLGDLAKQGKVGAVASVAKVGIGVAIRAGAPRPDIGSADALKHALLTAKAIAYSKEGQSGAMMAQIIERLGIADQMTPKTVLETRSGLSAAPVAEGKADLAFTLISEILPVPGVELAGPLPEDVQRYVAFTGGVSTASKQAQAAQAFIDFLKAPAAVPVLASKGMEPG